MRKLSAGRIIAMVPLCLALVTGASLLPASAPAAGEGGRGADGQAAGRHQEAGRYQEDARYQEISIQRELRLKRIERLARSGKLTDAGRLMPMLKDPDGHVRRHAENAIWLLWGRSGNAEVDRLFRAGVGQIGRSEIDQAIETFTRVVDYLPKFAEAWNKRATARFLAGDLAGAMDDCERALALVPDHFGALAGYGHIYFRLDDLDMAIMYWQRALAVNPNLLSVERSIAAAEKILVGRGRLRT